MLFMPVHPAATGTPLQGTRRNRIARAPKQWRGLQPLRERLPDKESRDEFRCTPCREQFHVEIVLTEGGPFIHDPHQIAKTRANKLSREFRFRQ